MIKPSGLAAFAVFLLSLSAALASSCPPETRLASGIVIGTTTSLPSAIATVNKFLGIPLQLRLLKDSLLQPSQKHGQHIECFYVEVGMCPTIELLVWDPK